MNNNTPAHSDYSDIEYESAFANCELDPAIFNHEAHIRLAWIHLHKYGLDTALANIESQLKRFVAHAGASDKYHHTLTIVAIQAVHHFMQRFTADNFPEFIAACPQLTNNFKGLVNSHYSYDIFGAEAARGEYMAPDVQPFEHTM